VLRTGAASWPRGWEVLNVPMGAFNTLVLIVSSVTMVMAYAKAWARDKKGFQMYLGATIALSLLFLVVKSFEYAAKFKAGHFPPTNVFFAVYFTMTGLHAIHIIGGILFNTGLLWWGSREGWDDPLFTGRVEYAGLYWHFVDIVWIFLFPSLYLL